MNHSSLEQYYAIFKKLPFKLLDPSKHDLKRAELLINTKDALILAAAMTGKVDWLLSLDKHFLSVDWQGKVDFTIGTPKDFLLSFETA